MIEFHRSPEAMARCLTSYITCDARVHSEVLVAWGHAPTVQTIRDMRRIKAKQAAIFARGPCDRDADQRGWDWRNDQVRESMEKASTRFIQAIERERAA